MHPAQILQYLTDSTVRTPSQNLTQLRELEISSSFERTIQQLKGSNGKQIRMLIALRFVSIYQSFP